MSKYCTNCGSKLDNDATFCIDCGTKYDSDYKGDNTNQPRINKSLILPAIGLALANSAPFVGLILSIIALKKSKDSYNIRGKQLAIAGITTSLFWILMFIGYIVIIVLKVNNKL